MNYTCRLKSHWQQSCHPFALVYWCCHQDLLCLSHLHRRKGNKSSYAKALLSQHRICNAGKLTCPFIQTGRLSCNCVMWIQTCFLDRTTTSARLQVILSAVQREDFICSSFCTFSQNTHTPLLLNPSFHTALPQQHGPATSTLPCCNSSLRSQPPKEALPSCADG